jgi:hypothetical protein
MTRQKKPKLPDPLDKYERSDEPGVPKGPRHRSRLSQALAAQKPWELPVDLQDVIGHVITDGDRSICKAIIRINSKTVDNNAITAGYAEADRLSQRAEGGAEALKQDSELLEEEKNLLAMWNACYDPEAPGKRLFMTPGLMRDALGTDEINALINVYNLVRNKRLGIPANISEIDIDNVRDLLVASFNTELPEKLMATWSSEYVKQLLTIMAMSWHSDRREVVELLRAKLPSQSVARELDLWEQQAMALVSEWGLPEAPKPDEDELDDETPGD